LPLSGTSWCATATVPRVLEMRTPVAVSFMGRLGRELDLPVL
jgi:hypothetical protein